MPNRRQFLAGVGGLGAGILSGSEGLASEEQKNREDCCERCQPEFIQPDYQAWMQATAVGNTERQVEDILGKPLVREYPASRQNIPEEWKSLPEDIRNAFVDSVAEDHCYGWTYGRLDFKSNLVPYPYEFTIYFHNGKVMFCSDPFERPLSTNGLPTTPVATLPIDKLVLPACVDIVDFRWQLPSGEYPVRFVVECVGGNDTHIERPDGELKRIRNWSDPVKVETDVPHFAYPNPGYRYHRWRVMAKNAKGEGPWSPWREFRIES